MPCRIIHASFAETLWCSKDWSVTLLRFFPPWRKKDNSVSYNPNYFVKWTEGGGAGISGGASCTLLCLHAGKKRAIARIKSLTSNRFTKALHQLSLNQSISETSF